MKKLKMSKGTALTFEEGCNLYLNNRRERNLRYDTIRLYRQSYDQFYKFFDRDMPVKNIYFITMCHLFHFRLKKRDR